MTVITGLGHRRRGQDSNIIGEVKVCGLYITQCRHALTLDGSSSHGMQVLVIFKISVIFIFRNCFIP